MTKEQYLTQRNLINMGNINIHLLFEFWQDNKREVHNVYSLGEFEQLVQLYLQHGGGIDRNELIDYFDRKFEVTKVINAKGQTLKVL